MIRFGDVHCHKLNQPDNENRLSILLDVDIEQALAQMSHPGAQAEVGKIQKVTRGLH